MEQEALQVPQAAILPLTKMAPSVSKLLKPASARTMETVVVVMIMVMSVPPSVQVLLLTL